LPACNIEFIESLIEEPGHYPGSFRIGASVSTLLKLIDEFSAREVVPIEVDEIADYLRSLGIKDKIFFFDADLDIDVLRGSLVHWEYQMEGWTYKVADIYTAKTLSPEEKRVVQAKELLHILDHRVDRASTPDEVDALIKKMALPIAEIDWKNDGHHAQSDRSAILYALPVLFPKATRDLFLPLYKANKIDDVTIAKLLALPKSIVAFVMSDMWVGLHDGMMAALRAELPVPDRVYTFNADKEPLEVHSVPLEDDPYSYAKRLEEKNRDGARPISSLMIETRRERRTFSASELAAYTPRSSLRG
jgi:hypothetical protein